MKEVFINSSVCDRGDLVKRWADRMNALQLRTRKPHRFFLQRDEVLPRTFNRFKRDAFVETPVEDIGHGK